MNLAGIGNEGKPSTAFGLATQRLPAMSGTAPVPMLPRHRPRCPAERPGRSAPSCWRARRQRPLPLAARASRMTGSTRPRGQNRIGTAAATGPAGGSKGEPRPYRPSPRRPNVATAPAPSGRHVAKIRGPEPRPRCSRPQTSAPRADPTTLRRQGTGAAQALPHQGEGSG